MLMFDRYGLDYFVVIEDQEYDDYAKVIDEQKLIVLPFRDKGLTQTRNWIWDYAENSGVEKFWTFDDNISDIYMLHNNLNIKMDTGIAVPIIEKFADRYENVSIAGMNYYMFTPRRAKKPPYTVNTRVYSNMLLNTKDKNPDGTPFRNQLFYNDDTDLNIRVLKKGSCTIQFNIFNILKATTMTVKGGLTESYNEHGRKRNSQMLVDAHPDVAELVWKYGRWHHSVNYRAFKKNRLIKKPNLNIPQGVNNYGLVLKNKKT